MIKSIIKSLSMLVLFGGAYVTAEAQNSRNVEFSLVFGNNTMLSQNTTEYLLPKYNTSSATPGTGIGIENAEGTQSKDPGFYLNLGDLGSNSALNMIGAQTRFFLSQNLDLNVMFAMNIAKTPKKDFIDGVQLNTMSVPQQRFIEGRLQSNLMGNLGMAYHINVGNTGKVDAYIGGQLGYQLARIQTITPYTGDDTVITYHSQSNAGEVMAFQGAVVGGVAGVTNMGLVIGLEISPFAYQYSLYQVGPQGYGNYEADHHSFRVFANPMLKLGYRF